jgi:cobalt/nickel transport protein
VKKVWNLLLTVGVLAPVAVPLLLSRPGDTGRAFSGTDDQAEETIKEVQPDYVRWTRPVWEPPSGEVKTLLFSVQAAVGAGVLGYVIGYLRGRAVRPENSDARG